MTPHVSPEQSAPSKVNTSVRRSSWQTYAAGYVLSLFLTTGAYLLVTYHVSARSLLIIAILVLAITQLVVQLFYFMHLHKAVKAPWNIIIFLFMTLVVTIVVFGSLWIMRNLSYNMSSGVVHGKSPTQVDQYIQHDELIKKDH